MKKGGSRTGATVDRGQREGVRTSGLTESMKTKRKCEGQVRGVISEGERKAGRVDGGRGGMRDIYAR